MFHLFKKIYLDFDDRINMSNDRIICSDTHGGIDDLAGLSAVFYGDKMATAKSFEELIGEGKPYPTMLALLETVDAKLASNGDNPIYIYCDTDSYFKFMVTWLKILLPYCDSAHGWKFIKSHLFKEMNFMNSRMSSAARFINDPTSWSWDQFEAQILQLWDSIIVERLAYRDFLVSIQDKLRVEFLLTGYLYDSRYAESFAKCITPLIKKDLEKFLSEHKEIILVHFQRPIFQDLLEVENGPYTFDNFYDMVNDPSPYVQVMFKPEIWGESRTSMLPISSKGNINFSGITDNDIENLKKYSVITGKIWSDEQWYMNLRSEVDKLDFIKMIRNKEYFTAEELDQIIQYELFHQYHAAGSFYAIDMRTVNTYFIDYILMNHENQSALHPYVFEIPE